MPPSGYKRQRFALAVIVLRPRRSRLLGFDQGRRQRTRPPNRGMFRGVEDRLVREPVLTLGPRGLASDRSRVSDGN
jgi:hypothetical protein